ncbi:Putative signal-transduction protein with CBS domains [Methanothrix harundinacea 6Ac]|uniref:Putative signal-transduction protein with CBS domains n=1 Tax=Methanothrix harundinacea (strain 6Ac) TaxID=1110509 RepID=G7WM84_METH6|nr:Putative signal-transduction protein with CBS domains [Methanothrix harundinacea 6Ac]
MITIDSKVDVVKAANKMFSANVGSLIVIHDDQPMGIITERDLVGKIVARAANPREVKVRDVMSSPLITVHPDVSLSEAAIKMLKSGVKRLPVISSDGKLVGIITDTDLVSGSASIGMGEILSHLIEMHRDSVHFEEQREMIRGICERCGQISDSLESVNGELLCWSCRDGNR